MNVKQKREDFFISNPYIVETVGARIPHVIVTSLINNLLNVIMWLMVNTISFLQELLKHTKTDVTRLTATITIYSFPEVQNNAKAILQSHS